MLNKTLDNIIIMWYILLKKSSGIVKKREDAKMRTITIDELKATGVNTLSVKDNSVRGYTTKYIGEVKPGDKVVIDNCFTLVTE